MTSNLFDDTSISEQALIIAKSNSDTISKWMEAERKRQRLKNGKLEKLKLTRFAKQYPELWKVLNHGIKNKVYSVLKRFNDMLLYYGRVIDIDPKTGKGIWTASYYWLCGNDGYIPFLDMYGNANPFANDQWNNEGSFINWARLLMALGLIDVIGYDSPLSKAQQIELDRVQKQRKAGKKTRLQNYYSLPDINDTGLLKVAESRAAQWNRLGNWSGMRLNVFVKVFGETVGSKPFANKTEQETEYTIDRDTIIEQMQNQIQTELAVKGYLRPAALYSTIAERNKSYNRFNQWQKSYSHWLLQKVWSENKKYICDSVRCRLKRPTKAEIERYKLQNSKYIIISLEAKQ